MTISREAFREMAAGPPRRLEGRDRVETINELRNAYDEAVPVDRRVATHFYSKSGERWLVASMRGTTIITSVKGNETETSEFTRRRLSYKREGIVVTREISPVVGLVSHKTTTQPLERYSNDTTAAGKILDHIERLGQALRTQPPAAA